MVIEGVMVRLCQGDGNQRKDTYHLHTLSKLPT